MSARSPDNQYRVVRKRNRVPLSCGPCRNRKLKCNRAHPCENCIKREDAPSCSYAMPVARRRNQSSPGSSNSDEMQKRIDRLEGLVLALMTNGPQSAGPSAAAAAVAEGAGSTEAGLLTTAIDDDDMVKDNADADESDVDRVTNSLGILKVDANKSMYFGQSHWVSVLHDITEVKNYFKEHQKQLEEQARKVADAKNDDDSSGPGFLFNVSTPPDRSEILSSLPPRLAADRLVSRYFCSNDPALHILHGPTFQKDYDTHWRNPSATPIVWLGQLFAIMCLAMQSYHIAGDEPVEYQGRSMQVANTYRNRTIECLVLGDFCRPVSPMIETMILHLQGEHARRAEIGSWVMGGLIVRLAMKMGYHRDPSSFSDITPYQGELRRRVWTFVRMVDILLSFQMTLPNMVRSKDCDTKLPSNLYDEEIDEAATRLPPSRPITEPTPVSYMIAKARIAVVFGDIVEHTSSLRPCSYDDVTKLDEQLREARAAIPLHLRQRPMEESRMDPANLIIQRYSLELLYHKSQCVLHKPFLARARTHPRYAHSRRTCVDSSLKVMHHQAVLHRETCSQGSLRYVKWSMVSLMSHDFLLAAMIVALDLHHSFEAEASGQGSNDVFTWGLERHAEMILALETSNSIWKELRDQSIEAYKANKVLTVMLEKLKHTHPSRGTLAATVPLPLPFTNGDATVGTTVAASAEGGSGALVDPTVGQGQNFTQGEIKPEHSAAMTLGLLSSGGVNSSGPAASTGMGTTLLSDRSFLASSMGNLPINDTTPGLTLDYESSSDANVSVVGDPTASLFTMFGQHGNMMGIPANFDWEAWDSYIQGTNLDSVNNQMWGSLNMDVPVGMSATADARGDGGSSMDVEAGRQRQLSSAGSIGIFSPLGGGKSQQRSQQRQGASGQTEPEQLEPLISSMSTKQQQQSSQRQLLENYSNVGGIL